MGARCRGRQQAPQQEVSQPQPSQEQPAQKLLPQPQAQQPAAVGHACRQVHVPQPRPGWPG